MKRLGYLALPFFSIAILLSSCNLPQSGSQGSGPESVGTVVAETLAALTQSALQTPQASAQVPLASPTLQPSSTANETPTVSPTPTDTSAPSPTPTNTSASSPTPTITPIPKPGTITGNILGYPYGSISRLAIVAYGQEAPYNYSYWITAAGDTYFSMSSSYLIPGKYQVVAYDASGNSGGCTTLVTVISDQTVNCDITDWSSSYRAKPAGVPNP